MERQLHFYSIIVHSQNDTLRTLLSTLHVLTIAMYHMQAFGCRKKKLVNLARTFKHMGKLFLTIFTVCDDSYGYRNE